DPENGNQHLPARTLDTNTGTYLQKDPYPLHNTYQAFNTNPHKYTDPTGNVPVTSTLIKGTVRSLDLEGNDTQSSKLVTKFLNKLGQDTDEIDTVEAAKNLTANDTGKIVGAHYGVKFKKGHVYTIEVGNSDKIKNNPSGKSAKRNEVRMLIPGQNISVDKGGRIPVPGFDDLPPVGYPIVRLADAPHATPEAFEPGGRYYYGRPDSPIAIDSGPGAVGFSYHRGSVNFGFGNIVDWGIPNRTAMLSAEANLSSYRVARNKALKDFEDGRAFDIANAGRDTVEFDHGIVLKMDVG
ncbi:hypothetical protein ACFWBC_26505, partial [Streptomyces sp. NPDC059985]|uniref:hypothetical protein n=1 Tax=Streptomyces sp. NPDC059985 TaxID=3347025 RepID=UPI0036CC63EC